MRIRQATILVVRVAAFISVMAIVLICLAPYVDVKIPAIAIGSTELTCDGDQFMLSWIYDDAKRGTGDAITGCLHAIQIRLSVGMELAMQHASTSLCISTFPHLSSRCR